MDGDITNILKQIQEQCQHVVKEYQLQEQEHHVVILAQEQEVSIYIDTYRHMILFFYS
jgi:hypothetical protein